MNAKKKRLGRGLDALLSKPATPQSPAEETADEAAKHWQYLCGEIYFQHALPIDLLQRGQYQPRLDMRQDSLEELADSIKAQGVVQPIIVRPIAGKGEQRYEIIAGERRWRAAQLAELSEVPVVVRDVSDESAIAMALIENIQRENLTHAEAARAVGRSRAAVSNLLRLQDLSDKVKPMLEQRLLEMGHARALLSLTDPGQQLEAARKVAKQGLSVRATERLVRSMLDGPKKPPVPKKVGVWSSATTHSTSWTAS